MVSRVALGSLHQAQIPPNFPGLYAQIPASLTTEVGQTSAGVLAMSQQEELSATHFPDTSGIHLAKHNLCPCLRSPADGLGLPYPLASQTCLA